MRHLLIAAIAAMACACAGTAPPEDQTPRDYEQRMAEQHAQDRPTASPAAQASPAGNAVNRTESYGSVGGQQLTGYVALPASGQGALPGVLMFHEWWGLNDNIKSMANQLAAQGYVVLAPDMYGGKVATDPAQAQSLMHEALGNPDAIKQNLSQAFDHLKHRLKATRVGTIGWCFGGTMSFEAGKLLGNQLDAVVIYYGFVNGNKEELAQLKAPVLGIFGGKDEGIPLDTVKAFEQGLKSLGRSPQLRIYPEASHAFANPSGQAYRKADADDAWLRATQFLREHVQQPGRAGGD